MYGSDLQTVPFSGNMAQKLPQTRGSGKTQWGSGELALSVEAPAFNTRQGDRMNQELSLSKKESRISISSTSLSPKKEGVNTSNPTQFETSKTEDANLVKKKYPQTREAIRWQVEGVKDKYIDGLEPTAARPIKKPIF